MTTDPIRSIDGRDIGFDAVGAIVVEDPATGKTYKVVPAPTADLTPTIAELNVLHGNTATATELSLLHGITDKVTAGQASVTTATFNTVSTTTLAAVPGLSVPLVAAGTYIVDGHLFGAGSASAGIKVTLDTSDTLTLTSANITGANKNGATINAGTGVTALNSDLSNFADTYTDVNFEGSLVVATAGTLIVKAAQHTSASATSTITGGSYIRVRRV